VQWFEDIGSGAKQNREKLNLLMQQARRGRIDVVVAFKLDRLAPLSTTSLRSSLSCKAIPWLSYAPPKESTQRTRTRVRNFN
jgi:hypothetical protein